MAIKTAPMENLVSKLSTIIARYTLTRYTLRQIDKISFTDLSARAHNHTIKFHRNDYVIEKDEIAIIHVPKTGGTTLKNIISSIEIKDKVININKHMPVSLIAPPRKYQYITFMRNPIERVFSYYKMQLRDKKQPYHFHAKDGLSTLLQSCWEVRNAACMYYSGMVYENISLTNYNTALDNLDNFLGSRQLKHE